MTLTPEKKSKRGTNPNSLKNLELRGRTLDRGEPKRGHEISTTDTAWKRLRSIAKQHGFLQNVSALNEAIGQDEIQTVSLPAVAIAALAKIKNPQSYLAAAIVAQLEADRLLVLGEGEEGEG